MAGRVCKIYLVSPFVIEPEEFAKQLEEALSAVPPQGQEEPFVGAVQLRLDGADEQTWEKAITLCKPICAQHGAALVINGPVEYVARFDVDGFHTNEQGIAVKEARRIIGPERILGYTALASRDLAMKAGDDGADYVAFSTFYQQEGGVVPSHARPDLLAWWQEFFVLPVVAYGGINHGNCVPLVIAGADFIGVKDAVWNDEEGAAASVRKFHAIITETLQKA